MLFEEILRKVALFNPLETFILSEISQFMSSISPPPQSLSCSSLMAVGHQIHLKYMYVHPQVCFDISLSQFLLQNSWHLNEQPKNTPPKNASVQMQYWHSQHLTPIRCACKLDLRTLVTLNLLCDEAIQFVISMMVFEILVWPFIFTYANSWVKIGQSSKMLQLEHQNVPSSLVARSCPCVWY